VATLSLRKIARDRLGLTGDFSVNTHVYGYRYRGDDGSLFGLTGSLDILPGLGEPRKRSLKRHLRTIAGRATDLVIILVAHENDFSGVVTRNQVTKIQYAIQVARVIYAQVNFGIRKIRWQRIPVADAGGYADLAGRDEAQSLTEDWSSSGGGIDVFMAQSIGDRGGWSQTPGPCSKESKWSFSGAVLGIASPGRRLLGILLAHEVGHYLGLHHTDDITNVMGRDGGDVNVLSTRLTSHQGLTMRFHCSVTGPW
jgi:hypothetical protein